VSDRSLPGLAIDCAEVVELLTDYLEGALQEPVRAEIEAHLALCDGCDAYLAQMRSTIDLLGHVPVESLTEQVRNELLTAFRTIHTPREPITYFLGDLVTDLAELHGDLPGDDAFLS
jgi:anti-sigma factor RsiW